MGCFSFERVKVLIFKLFGRCFKPIGWDGDIRKLRKRLTKVYSFFCPVPTAWDGDRTISRSAYMLAGGVLFSEPIVWDGDRYFFTSSQRLFHSSEPTVWDNSPHPLLFGDE
jgi:hypothetical protein